VESSCSCLDSSAPSASSPLLGPAINFGIFAAYGSGFPYPVCADTIVVSQTPSLAHIHVVSVVWHVNFLWLYYLSVAGGGKGNVGVHSFGIFGNYRFHG
jgi:hypothetical protein